VIRTGLCFVANSRLALTASFDASLVPENKRLTRLSSGESHHRTSSGLVLDLSCYRCRLNRSMQHSSNLLIRLCFSKRPDPLGEPRWRGDTKEIYYIAPTGMLMAVPVDSAGTFSTGVPTTLFQVYGRAPISSTDVFTYDVTKDGKRFLVNRHVKPDHVMPLTIVLHATANPPK
jgi:hypothetical protein